MMASEVLSTLPMQQVAVPKLPLIPTPACDTNGSNIGKHSGWFWGRPGQTARNTGFQQSTPFGHWIVSG